MDTSNAMYTFAIAVVWLWFCYYSRGQKQCLCLLLTLILAHGYIISRTEKEDFKVIYGK